MKRCVLFLFSVLLLFMLTSCVSGLWGKAGVFGTEQDIRVKVNRENGSEYFYLTRPLKLPEEKTMLTVSVKSGGNLIVRPVYKGAASSYYRPKKQNYSSAVFFIALDSSEIFKGFEISEDSGSGLEIVSIRVDARGGGAPLIINTETAFSEELLSVELDTGGKAGTAAVFTTAGGGIFKLKPVSAENTVIFNRNTAGGSIKTVELGGDAATAFKAAYAVFGSLPALPEPLLSGAGGILAADRKAWRTADYELYGWDINPEVLVFDFSDHSVQAAFFTRLAFFVEKRGYAGRVLDDSELKGRHGWNAHDYRAEDLAAFFNAAADRGVRLNSREQELAGVLLANGILLRKNSRFAAGRGAVLSVSRQSSDAFRRKYLGHELLHGLFFTKPLFESRVVSAYLQLSPFFRAYWEKIMAGMTYDTGNVQLMANELMAYFMHDSLEALQGFLKAFTEPGLEEAVFSEAETAWYSFERILFEETGLKPGLFIELEK